jgi:hypothetical protein
MFWNKKTITVTLKFFSGLDKDLKLKGYDPAKGIAVTVPDGTRLKKILKSMGLKNISSHSFFLNAERVSAWTKLQEGNEVSCLRPSAGG